jgi:hypothetical protein
MRTVVAASFVVVLCGIATSTAHAQEGASLDRSRTEVSLREAAVRSLRSELRATVVRQDTVSAVRTRRTMNGRVDDAGVHRARYRIRQRVPGGLSAERAAVEHLVRSAREYGIGAIGNQLRVESVRGGRHASHVRIRQTLAGVPVYRREIVVSLDGSGQPTMVVNGYASHLEEVGAFDPVPAIPAGRARRIAQTASSRGLTTTEPELVVVPSSPPRLAWKISASSDVLPVEWEVLIDAGSGEVIQMLDVTVHGGGGFDANRVRTARGQPPGARGRPPASPAAPEAVALVDGTGFVFDPDPLTSSGAAYGGDFVDGNDADTPALNDQRFTVTLRDISRGTDGMYLLEGPYVRIVGSEDAVPRESSPHGFTYTRANNRFEAVNAYYHIDKSQRYLQSLGVGFPIKDEPVRVDPRAFTDDDSNYNPGQDIIRFGTGGIDDAEDADVIWHEYAHALLNFTTPGLTADNFEGRALHEGWADYWAASYSRYLSEEDPQIESHDWRRLYNWDGNTLVWQGRRLDHGGHYPDNMTYAGPNAQGMLPHYQWGLLWATTLMEIYPQIGRSVLDRLNLASHAYLASTSNFADAAEALIQADYDLYGGVHGSVLVKELGEAGYIDPASYGPVLEHEPLKASEQVSGTILVEVTASATTAAVDSVLLVFAVEDGPFERLELSPTSGDVYAGDLPLPDQPVAIRYYVEAVDAQGRRRRLPAGAPSETYSFLIGPDDEPPFIVHTPREHASVIAWPITLFAEIGDNIGVDSARVEFTLLASDGAIRDDGAFDMELEGGVYRGRFPESSAPVLEGDRAEYRIVARDASAAGHETSLPQEGTFSIEIVDDGVLRAYDFEGLNQGLTSEGIWTAGSPSYGLRVAHSGEHVWATEQGAAYPSVPDRSRLTLPPVDVEGLALVYLVFWHWYDIEHDGSAVPGQVAVGAGLRDGGNVKASTDGGETWTVLDPLGGYSGTIGEARGNPLGGEPAFGGYSHGWRREIIELPASADVRIRFEFGSDEGNDGESLFFAGWYVDDVRITTELPTDSEPPEANSLPPARTVYIPGQESPPTIAVEVVDDTGVESVVSQYEIERAGEIATGSNLLAMSGTDASIFEGAVVPIHSFEPGDRIAYTLRVRDFDGNEAVYGDPFVIDFLSEQRRTALRGAVATGVWHRLRGQWTTTGAVSQPISSLVLEPFTLPSNSESSDLVLEHAYDLSSSFGGNVKISTDDGASWSVLVPEAGYPSSYAPAVIHPMAQQPVFAGTTNGSSVTVFDLSEYAGQTLRARIDLAHTQPIEALEGWTISGLSFRSHTSDDAFQIDRELALHANFPDPVTESTTISYTVPGEETIAVRLSVYDPLGRRVAMIRHAQHEPGTYTLQYDASDLANGAYVLYLETNRGTRTEHMIVLHTRGR